MQGKIPTHTPPQGTSGVARMLGSIAIPKTLQINQTISTNDDPVSETHGGSQSMPSDPATAPQCHSPWPSNSRIPTEAHGPSTPPPVHRRQPPIRHHRRQEPIRMLISFLSRALSGRKTGETAWAVSSTPCIWVRRTSCSEDCLSRIL